MLASWRQNCILCFTLLLAFDVLMSSSEASRFPKAYSFDQMLPKKLPTPSSAPSKGTNSVSTWSSTAVKTDKNLPSSDGKNRPYKNIRIKHMYIVDDPFDDPGPQLSDFVPDTSPEDDWVPLDEQLAPQELVEVLRAKDAYSIKCSCT
ncbi:hypothetical protein Ddye_005910 [Dipteronia dyeriana]|uniref:Uncharacterized protein n=1 Tax=Dipteronia dyeriana TaxID=168575 RepID=A0AAD9XHF1_9ROSI|nr:hypothetical protein Ddye_005910 [Dipteronia dyeriana]